MLDMKESENKMKKAVDALERNLSQIRAGRANPAILDRVTVEYYGAPTPLAQVGTVSVPEARMIQIQPWEASLIKDIEKAILVSDLGLTPNNDGKVIRLVFPELTEDRRKELAKDIIFGQLRLIIATMDIEEINSDRDKFLLAVLCCKYADSVF